MKKMRFEGTRKIDIVGMAICGGLTLLTLLEVINPHLQNRDLAKAQQLELAERRAKSMEVNGSLELHKKRLHSFQQSFENGPHKLLSITQMNQRLVELTELATREGLSIRTLQPGATTSMPRYQIVQIDVGGVGSYRSAASFLHNLQEVFGDMGVTSFELSVEQSDAGQQTTFRFALAWYVRPISPNSK